MQPWSGMLDGVPADSTVSLVESDEPTHGRGAQPTLILALHAARPLAEPLVVSLDGVDEVVFARGEETAVLAGGDRQLRVELADVAVSSRHARLACRDTGFTITDEGSKNGTVVDGRRVASAPLGPDVLLELGNCFFCFRRGGVAPIASPPAFRTLSFDLARRLEIFERVAASQLSILIEGETGTGKELFARTAHTLSRRTGQFVAVNCGAMPAALIESELFGARRGAFTGAVGDRPGLVAAADHGTLFLDEIADLPEPSQAALLRVLQEGEVRPLGAVHSARVDVRVVAATHKSLPDLVATGRFRDDLHARLRGHVLSLPPLRARREDLGLLIAAILPRVRSERAGPIVFQRAAARALLAFRWPHNIRELEHVLGRAVALAGNNEIRIDHLPDEIAGRSVPVADERQQLVELLRTHSGNLSAVARALVTSRTQVQRLLARHGIAAAEFRTDDS